MTFWEHLEALRQTLLRMAFAFLGGVFCAFIFARPLLAILLHSVRESGVQLILTSPLEGFTSTLKVALWGGLLLASPLSFLFLLQFVAPALKKEEKRIVFPFLLLSSTLMFLGVLLGYFYTLPKVTHFFYAFNAGLGENFWLLSKTLSFTLSLLAAHALIFEVAVVLFLAVHFGMLGPSLFSKSRRGAYVAIFLFSALLTPPDVFTQILMALPLLLIFEGSALYARMKDKNSCLKSDVAS